MQWAGCGGKVNVGMEAGWPHARTDRTQTTERERVGGWSNSDGNRTAQKGNHEMFLKIQKDRK